MPLELLRPLFYKKVRGNVISMDSMHIRPNGAPPSPITTYQIQDEEGRIHMGYIHGEVLSPQKGDEVEIDLYRVTIPLGVFSYEQVYKEKRDGSTSIIRKEIVYRLIDRFKILGAANTS